MTPLNLEWIMALKKPASEEVLLDDNTSTLSNGMQVSDAKYVSENTGFGGSLDSEQKDKTGADSVCTRGLKTV
jgi:hypothetical protein